MDPTLAATWGVLFRQAILIAAGSAATWSVQKGWMSQDNANSLVSPVVAFAVSFVAAAATVVWGWWARTKGKLGNMLANTEAGRRIMAEMLAKSEDGKSKMIGAVADMPGITSIHAEPSIANAQPSDKVVATPPNPA